MLPRCAPPPEKGLGGGAGAPIEPGVGSEGELAVDGAAGRAGCEPLVRAVCKACNSSSTLKGLLMIAFAPDCLARFSSKFLKLPPIITTGMWLGEPLDLSARQTS